MAMENIYSENSSVIPQKFNMYRSCIKSSIEVLKSIKFGIKIILMYFTSIPFSIDKRVSLQLKSMHSPFSFGHCVVLRFMDSDYPFDIFKLFLIPLFIIVQCAYFHFVYRICLHVKCY